MKKLIAGLFAAILTTAGLVAVTSTPAAADCRTGYRCTNTSSDVKAPNTVTQGKPVKVKVKIDTRGNVKADGIATIVVTGPGGYKDTIKVKIVNGKLETVNLGKLGKPGKYKMKITFKGDDGFRDSASTDSFTVKKKKKG